MAFFKHKYEVRELIRKTDNGWSSWNVKYIGDDEHKANRIYATLKKENPEKEYVIEDYVTF